MNLRLGMVLVLMGACVTVGSAETNAMTQAAPAVDAQDLIDGGIAYLLSKRDERGGWSLQQGALRPAMTAMVLKALVQSPEYGPSHPIVKKGFEVLLSYQQGGGPNRGGIFNPDEGMANYSTALAVMALAAANNPHYADAMSRAVGYLRQEQIVPGSETPDQEKLSEDHPFVGGVGYGTHGRPDLSNAGMWIHAMHDAGIPPEDPAMRRAVLFLQRTQNRSESNTLGWAAVGPNDGGFVYAPAVQGNLTKGESKAGEMPEGRGLRSYGSMTYVGFKSLLCAGLSKDDPRVRAAFDWIRRYWRLDGNPNMPQATSLQGLYYYYHAFAKALRAWGEDTITDMQGRPHDWRAELTAALAQRVREDGSWVNDADRWHEGDPVLVTAYAVLALQEADKPQTTGSTLAPERKER
jgi:squalene-hopene/tetraprenyl-beta-curcumene cyclase